MSHDEHNIQHKPAVEYRHGFGFENGAHVPITMPTEEVIIDPETEGAVFAAVDYGHRLLDLILSGHRDSIGVRAAALAVITRLVPIEIAAQRAQVTVSAVAKAIAKLERKIFVRGSP